MNQFNQKQLGILGDAADIAEDLTSNHFKLSASQWKRHPFDIRLLTGLFGKDVKNNAFAVLKKYVKPGIEKTEPIFKRRDYYIIYLQENKILKAIERDQELKLLSLLAYVLTHELVHIVRFCNFQAIFDTEETETRIKEEKIVHQITQNILKNVSLPCISYILDSYSRNDYLFLQEGKTCPFMSINATDADT